MHTFTSMKGLGDNIYQRAFVKQFVQSVGEIALDTPWPEIYSDLTGVSFIRPITRLRTQNKNIAAQPDSVWARARVKNYPKIKYGPDGICAGMRRCFGVDAQDFDLPFHSSPIKGPYAVIRPATIRQEWPAHSRNPLPEYLCECADALSAIGLPVVSIADLDHTEYALEPLPKATTTFHEGELGITGTLGLIAGASIVVSGIGWVVPAAIAYKVPSWFICGGWGAYNSPQNLVDERIMDLSRAQFVLPDNFCLCADANHQCDKRITDHAQKFAQFLGRFPDLVSREGHGVSPTGAHVL